MANIKTIDLRRGQAVQYKSGIWVCVKNDKVAKGNWRSSQVIQLKNFQTGQLIEERFRTDEIFELAMLERKPMKYLYSDAKSHIFMDMESFEETHIDAALVGDESVYLVPDLEVTICTVEGKPVLVELPNTVALTIQDTPPELKGATVTNTMKEAICEGGAKVKVPPFITNGTKIIVDTRTGEYLNRA
jgi:elongation factor P